jgi:hypothetical protein
MNNQSLILSINNQLNTQLPDTLSKENLLQTLSEYINFLIQKDFQKLVSILYRIDVSENKLKQVLENSNEEAGKIIATLIIERQEQKIKSRQQFSQRDNTFFDEEERL